MNLSDLKRAAEHADSVQGNPRTRLADVHGRIRSARRRRAAGVAAAVVVAVGLSGAAYVGNLLADPSIGPAAPSSALGPQQTPPEGWCTASPTASTAGPVGFIGLPPKDAVPSTTRRSELVLGWFGDAGYVAKSNLWLFDDGRLIVQHDGTIPKGPWAGSQGYLERCLAPSGVEALRRYVLDSAHIKVAEPPYPAWLRVRPVKGAELVDLEHGTVEPRRLFEPESWLPAAAFVDRGYRPYVAAQHSFCTPVSGTSGGPPAALDDVPPNVAAQLRTLRWTMRRDSTPAHTCAVVTTTEARWVAQAIEASWFAPGYEGPPAVLDVGLYRRETQNVTESNRATTTYVGIEPVLPDGQFTCNCG